VAALRDARAQEREDEKPDVTQPRSDTPILWIRIDPEFEMLRYVSRAG
jgi:hypothetical protein